MLEIRSARCEPAKDEILQAEGTASRHAGVIEHDIVGPKTIRTAAMPRRSKGDLFSTLWGFERDKSMFQVARITLSLIYYSSK